VLRRVVTIAVSSALAVGLGGVSMFLSVPYVGLAPAAPYNTLATAPGASTEPMIEISGRTVYREDGQLDFTVVNVLGRCEKGLPLSTAVRYWFDSDAAVVPKGFVCPEGKSDEETNEQVQQEMVDSQRSAKVAALRELGIDLTSTVSVRTVTAGSPAARAGLAPKDVLVSVDRIPVTTAEELRAAIGRRSVGQALTLRYRRGGQERDVRVGTVASDDAGPTRPTIGVEVEVESELPFPIEVRTDPVGGPSAGLMLALGIIDLLEPGSLTGGEHVAGTGTIDEAGVVGAIGGIQQKLAGARDAGAEHFLVPAGNWEKAQRVQPDGLELYRIETLDDALAALTRIRSGAG
jgi:Lon-like protease